MRKDNKCKRGHVIIGDNIYHRPNTRYLECVICRRTATKLAVDNKLFGGLGKHVMKRDSYRRVRCSMTREEHLQKWGRNLSIDHIDGNGRGNKNPNNDPNNLQVLCLSCHGKKDVQRRKSRPVKMRYL